jgi:hypothetical protein
MAGVSARSGDGSPTLAHVVLGGVARYQTFARRPSTHRAAARRAAPRDNDVMNTPSEPLSNRPGTGKGHWLNWRLRISMTVVAVVVVGVAVVAIAAVAAFLLASADPHSDWIPVYQDILKTSFGALAVGGLGGLAKVIFDQHRTREAAEADQRRRDEAALADERKAREAAEAELRDRRYRFISTLVDVSHDIDTAKLHIRANRSVKSWTDMVNERIVPARSRLGNMSHELSNWTSTVIRWSPRPAGSVPGSLLPPDDTDGHCGAAR